MQIPYGHKEVSLWICFHFIADLVVDLVPIILSIHNKYHTCSDSVEKFSRNILRAILCR